MNFGATRVMGSVSPPKINELWMGTILIERFLHLICCEILVRFPTVIDPN